MGGHAIYSGLKEYRNRWLRKRKGLKQTETESSDERAEIENIIKEHEQEIGQAKVEPGDELDKPEDAKIQDEEGKQEAPLTVLEPSELQVSNRVLVENPEGEKQSDGPIQPASGNVEEGVAAEEKSAEKKKKKKSCFKCKNPYIFFLALLMCSEWGDRS